MTALLPYERVAPALVVLYGAAWATLGAKAPPGWGDSATYLDLALRLPEVLAAGDAGYFALRILPSAIVHVALRALGLPLDPQHAFRAFEILDVGLLALGAWAWGRIGRILAWDRSTLWLGFVLVFASYAVTGFGLVVPPLTDTAAVAIGLLQTWFFLSGRATPLVLVTLAAAFTWPQAFVAGLLLFVFPRRHADDRAAPLAGTVAGLLMVALHGLWVWWLWRTGQSHLPFAGQQIHWGLLAFSLAGTAGYMLLLARGLVGRSLALSELLAPGWARRLVVAGVLVLATASAADALGYGHASRYPTLLVTPWRFLSWSVLTSVVLPLLAPLAHVLYFGPLLLMVAFRADATARVIRGWGAGASLYALGYGLLMLNPSSRVSVSFLPFLVAAVCTGVLCGRCGRRAMAFLGLLAVLLSRVWLPTWTLIGDVGLFERRVPELIRWIRSWLPLRNLRGGAEARYLDFPHQWFFMTQGPWMSVEMYAAQGAAVVFLGALVALALRARGRPGATAGAAGCDRASGLPVNPRPPAAVRGGPSPSSTSRRRPTS